MPGPKRCTPAAWGERDLSRLSAAQDRALEAAQAAIRDTTRLTRLLSVLGDPAPLGVLLDRALSVLSELFAADIVALLDPDGTGVFSPLAAVGLPEEMLGLPLSDAADGPVATAMRTGLPVLSFDADADPGLDAHLRELGVQAAVWAPAADSTKPRGVLVLARCRRQPFTTADVDLLMVMAQRIMLTVEQAQITVQFGQIAQAGRHIGAFHDEAAVGDDLVAGFPTLLGAQAAALFLLDAGGKLRCVARAGLDPAWPAVAIPLTAWMLAHSPLAQGRPFSTGDLMSEGFAPDMPGEHPVRALLAVPILRNGEAHGVLYAMRFTRTRFPESTLQIAMVFAAQASTVLENAALYQSIRSELAVRTRAELDLKLSQQQTEAANRSKSEFLANMSHEIRTPLNGILGMLQLLQTTALDIEQETYVSSSIRAAQRLTQLLSDILDLSRIEAGKLTLQSAAFAVDNLWASVRELFGPAANDKGLSLAFNLDRRLPSRLEGDETRVRQILFNLVGNAVKFTEAGSIHVGAHLLPVAGNGAANVLLTVRDTGIGIPDDTLHELFKPFTQAKGNYTRALQGAGLGLSIVNTLLKMMGGTLAVDSTEGQGTTMYLSLPFRLPVEECPRMDCAAPGRPVEGMSLRILYAEDDETSMLYGRRTLELAGHAVAIARTGREVVERFAQQDFDLVLMDIQMPVMDGVEATRAIRESSAPGRDPRIPIIAMTAYAMTGDREKFLAAGMDDYVAKPVDMDELARVLARVHARRKPPRARGRKG